MKSAVCWLLLVGAANGWGRGAPGAGQETGSAVRGPWLGLVFDEAARSVRPVLGLPGAATLGAALKAPFALERAVAAHRAAFALGVDGRDGAVILITGAGARKLRGVAAAPGEIVFSPSASTAALYYGDRDVIEVVRGLPEHPEVAGSLDAAVLPGPLSALAVSDDGLVLAGCQAGPDSAVVYRFRLRRQSGAVLSGRRVAAIAFVGSSEDALVADAAAHLVYRLRNGGGAAVIAGAAEGISAPVALGASVDGKRAAVANGGGGPVLVLDLQSGAATPVACACKVSEVEPMAGNAVFRLTDASQPRMWVLDADGGHPRVVFVPQAAVSRQPSAIRTQAGVPGEAGAK